MSNETDTPLDKQIACVLKEMSKIGVNSEEYPVMMTYLERMYALRRTERRAPISRDTMVLVIGSLIEILVIVGYEQKHVITSKGLSRTLKPRAS